MTQDEMRAWFAKNRTAVLIGCGVVALLAVAGSGNEGGSGPQQQPPQQPDGGPVYGGGGGAGDGGGGGVDIDEWRRRERASDEAQRERVRTIREEERCADGNTVSIHTGC